MRAFLEHNISSSDRLYRGYCYWFEQSNVFNLEKCSKVKWPRPPHGPVFHCIPNKVDETALKKMPVILETHF